MSASTSEPTMASPPSSPCLRRQRSMVSTLYRRSRVCIGSYSLSSYDFDDLFQELPSRKAKYNGGFSCLHGGAPARKQGSAWQESSTRLLGPSRSFKVSTGGLACCNGGACPEPDEAEDVAYCKPSPWKLFIRKIRAETKKMNCGARPSAPAFHYDALSYAMNFDDGAAWQPPQQQYFEYESSDNIAASPPRIPSSPASRKLIW